MAISGVSGLDTLATAVARSESQVGQQIALSVLKQVMDQSKAQAAALLAENAPAAATTSSPDGLGRYVDVSA